MESMDLIQTEISEDLLHDILIRTYPKKFLVFLTMLSFILIVGGTFIISLVIYVYLKYNLFDSRFKRYMAMGIGFLLWGFFNLIKVVRTPRINTEKWLKNLRIQTGQSDLHLNLQFLEEELTVCNTDIEEDLHIPYDYIHTIFILDGVMVLATKQGRINIMRKDLPKEEEFTQWLLSKCGRVKVKNMVKN